jgi:arylsulfatase A-like enzyme
LADILVRPLFLIVLVGLQFGILATANLRRGGFSLSGSEGMALAGGHILLALAVGAPALLLALSIRFARRRFDEEARGGRLGILWRAAPSLAVCWTLFVLLGAYINVEFLPTMLSPASLLADAALLLVIAGGGWAWSIRPWGRRLDGVLVAVILAADFAVGIWASSSIPGASDSRVATVDQESVKRPNIVLLLLDTLRADHLGAYGYQRETAPRIKELANSGILFERAYSSTNWTRPAVASLFTSTMPSRHRLNAVDRALSPSLPLLAETLSAVGYRTVFVSAGPNIEPEDGYGRGVDHFDYSRARPPLLRTPLIAEFALRYFPSVEFWFRPRGSATNAADPAEFTDRALRWAAEIEKERPLFLYVHYLGPHSPYDPPFPYYEPFTELPPVKRLLDPPSKKWAGQDWLSPSDRQQMIDQYDGEILWHDGQVGRLIDRLRELGRLDDAVVVVIADHGEGFGEHGLWSHNAGMFDDVVRIPMIFWSPNRWAEPSRLSVPVSLIDVAPTLAAIAGAEIPGSFDGGNLLPWIEKRTSRGRIVFTENPNNGELGIRTGEWAYFEGSTAAGFGRWLFRADDHEGREDLSETHPELVEEFHQLVQARREVDRSLQAESVEIELDDQRRQELRALGYVE